MLVILVQNPHANRLSAFLKLENVRRILNTYLLFSIMFMNYKQICRTQTNNSNANDIV